MKKYMLALATVAMTLAGCTSTQSEQTQQQETPKSLVLYYSQTGTTKAVAEELQKLLNADMEAVECENPYQGTYAETIARCQKEREAGEFPEIKSLHADISQYDTIYLGYPVWFGTYALPMATLVNEANFEGKVIIPFCTFGSGGLSTSTADLRKALSKAEILEGYGVRTARIAHMPKEVDRFLKQNGYLAGDVPALPDFSAQQPVTQEETAIFNAACSDYQFPLGTPVTVGSRAIEEGTEYKYTVTSKGPDGTESTSTIYVIAGKEEGAKPEFTQVVR